MRHGPSTRWLPRLLILLAFVCLAAASALTTDDVIRMAKEGQSDRAILAAIHESGASFDLTADEIADLHDQGVSDKVIDAMIETAPATREEASAEEPEPEPAPPYAIAYPVYPLYYPWFVPVFDPFFFGFPFVSFGFVHVSHSFAVFPCVHHVVVVSNAFVGARPFGARAVVASTTRFVPRAGSSFFGRPGSVVTASGGARVASPIQARPSGFRGGNAVSAQSAPRGGRAPNGFGRGGFGGGGFGGGGFGGGGGRGGHR
jgi:hypothetical protein